MPPIGEEKRTPAAAELTAQLWDLYCSRPPEACPPPWDGISAALRARLEAALLGATARRAAAAATALPAAEATAALRHSEPALYRLVCEVKGFAAATANLPPGVPLVYEELNRSLE